jgi:hypothetical protein
MPARNPVANGLRVDESLTIGTDTRATVHYFFQFVTGTTTAPNLNAVCTNMVGFWTSDMAPQCTAFVTLTQLKITDLTSATSPIGVSTGTSTGTRAAPGLPQGVAAIIQRKVGRRYRGGHSRVYYPAGASADLATADTWTSAFTTGLLTNWNGYQAAWINQLTSVGALGGVTAVNVSYFNGFTVVTNPITGRARNVPKARALPLTDVIASTAINPKIGVQRRRFLQSA